MGKIIIFGIDGGSLELIEQWREELPTLKKLMAEGVYGELESTIPPLTCPAWPSMFTGKNPGKLGMFDFTKHFINKTDMTHGINTSLDYAPSAIWNILNKHGKRVGLFNLPFTFPPQKVDSFVVCGMDAASALKRNYTYPPELSDILNGVVGGYEILPLLELTIPNREQQYIEIFDKMIEKREKAARYLLDNYNWDLFICVFFALDSVQHYYWHHMDEDHIRHRNDKYRDVIKHFYIKLDTAIGRLLQNAPQDINILLVSDHGFGPLHGKFLTNRWLANNGFLKLKDKLERKKISHLLFGTRDAILSHVNSSLIRFGSKMLPRIVIKRMANLQAEVDNVRLLYKSIDWTKTKAYAIGNVGMIYINLEGRQPWGIVRSGKEYEEVRNEITRRLREIIDPETGNIIDVRIFKKEEVYSGPYLESAPDILYHMSKYIQSTSIWEEAEWGTTTHSGQHAQKGIFIASGPDIKNNGAKLSGLKIYDIAPTILHWFGLPIARDIDGKVLTEIFRERSAPAEKSVLYRESSGEIDKIKLKVKKLKESRHI